MGADTAFVLDTQGLFNSVTATRDGGATQVYSSASSVAKYEQYPTDLTLLVTTDDEAFNAAAWVVNTHAEPAPRLPSVTVDLVTQTAAKAAAVQALELGTAFTLTALPTQAPTTSTTLFAEGWSEVIGTESWEMTFNTSSLNTVWVLQDATYGALDGLNRLAY
jgi:LmbE family N-acetylglucosaminyl deacetylase